MSLVIHTIGDNSGAGAKKLYLYDHNRNPHTGQVDSRYLRPISAAEAKNIEELRREARVKKVKQ